MKKKNGFTIVELLSVMVILAIVLGIVSVAFININKSLEKAYYSSLEESLLISGGDYFAYNKDMQPTIFGTEAKVTIQELITNQYTQGEVKARDGSECDPDSYVGAFKDSYDKTNYYVCLSCGSYQTDSPACRGEFSYKLSIKAKLENSNTIYNLNSNSWVNDNIILTFETLNDIKNVFVENESGEVVGSCNIQNNSCQVKVSEKGNYTAYGTSENGTKTKEEDVTILIDKNKPTFIIENTGTNNIIEYETNENNIDISNVVKEIEDLESGIKSIKYSLEKDLENFININNTLTTFDIDKNLGGGSYKLIVQVTDNAGNTNTQEVIYNIFQKISKPTSAYCKDNLIYNGSEQILTNDIENGFTFSNNYGKEIGDYIVKASLDENFRWEDNTTDDVEFTCTINPNNTAQIGSCRDLTYNGSNQILVSGGSNVTYHNNEGINANFDYTVTIKANENYTFSDGSSETTLTCSIKQKDITIKANDQAITYGSSINKSISQISTEDLISGHEISNITLTPSTDSVTTTGTINPSDAIIKSGTNDVTNNYNINYLTGNLTITKSNTATIGTCNDLTYDGNLKTLVSGGLNVTYENNTQTDAETYTVTVKTNENYTFSNGKTEETITCTIKKRSLIIKANDQTITYGSNISNTTNQVTATTLVSGHTISNITLTPSTLNTTDNGTITPSDATINSGTNDVTSNYDISYQTGTLKINKASTALVGSCRDLTYNGTTQILASGGSNVTYHSNEGTDAKSYIVTIKANPNYTFTDGSSETTLTCTIQKRNLTITANNQTITYGSSINKSISQVTTEDLISGHEISNITLTPSTDSVTTTGTINPSDAIIKSGTNDVTNNYNINYLTGNLTITKSNTATIGTCNDLTYDGNIKTLVSGGLNVTYENNTRTDAGTYTVTVKTNANYAFSNGETEDTITCTIKKKSLSIKAKDQTITYGNSISTSTNQVTATTLVSGHTISNITLTPSTLNTTDNGTITPSDAIIKSGTNDVTSNYDISYQTGTLKINKANTALVGSCRDLTYNDTTQILASGGSNVTYHNNEGIDAISYIVTIKANPNYTFADGSTETTLTCSIKPKDITIKANNQTITYGNSINTSTNQVTATTLVSGHTISNITLSQSTSNVTENATITPSNATIKSGSTVVTNNYNISYQTGTLIINRAKTATTGSCNSLTYNGNTQTLASGGSHVTYNNNSESNFGTYSVTVTTDDNYAFSDGSTITNLYCSIEKRNLTIKANNQTITYGNNISTLISQVTPTNLISGHTISSITLTPSTLNATDNATITPSDAIIKSGSTDVSNNYNITYQTGTLKINKSSTATTGSCNTLTYDGTSKILVSGGSNVTYYDNEGVDAKSYTVTIKANPNYTFSNGSSETTLTCSINKRNATIKANNQTIEAGSVISKTTSDITATNLLDSHSITNITLTQSTTEPTTSGTITPSDATIKSGSTDVTSNYNITYQTGTLTVNSTVEYCATFYLNGAKYIDGVENNKQLCCKPGNNTSCTITTPTITAKDNFSVIGWNIDSEATTKTHNVNTSVSLTTEENSFFAITKSTTTPISKNVTFHLNGATSYTYNGTKYTTDKTFTCTTSYVYNGAEIPDYCNITLPTITRTNGDVYGWNEDSEATSATNETSTTLSLYDDTDLFAITSRDISLTFNGNGGTSKIPTQTEKVYNDSKGAWFDVPAYDYANMCRTRDTEYVGYKYVGLGEVADSTTAKYCQGDRIYLEEDTSLYAVWKQFYAEGKTTGNLNIRATASTTGSYVGVITTGKSAYFKAGTYDSRTPPVLWYNVIYGDLVGWSSSKYIDNDNIVWPKESSCNYTDYTCSGNGTNYSLTATPTDVVLNPAKSITTKQITVESQCGDYTFKSNDTSLITVSNTGLITYVNGSVSENQEKSTTVTITAEGGCSATVNVKVKNTTATTPTVTITFTGKHASCSGYYTKSATATVTCESDLPITEFTAKLGSTTKSTTITDTYKTTATISWSTTGTKNVTATCSNSEGTASASGSVGVRVYSQSSSCSCNTKYTSSTASACGHCSSWSTYSNFSYANQASKPSDYCYLAQSGGANYFFKKDYKTFTQYTSGSSTFYQGDGTIYRCSSYACKTYNSCCHT